jgi:hypothetical protein
MADSRMRKVIPKPLVSHQLRPLAPGEGHSGKAAFSRRLVAIATLTVPSAGGARLRQALIRRPGDRRS